ncbi:MAG: cyclase dehydrase, partial [Myxococcota bacterium]|nr:cyclase dehydrase [Myxococcota bacterium]
MVENKMARGLAWFGIGLGIAEIVAGGRLASSMGVSGKDRVVRLCGMREIANGAGILLQSRRRRTGRWMWGRVLGDVLDLALVGKALA